MRLGILSDTHLGIKRFYDDAFNQFEAALRLLKEHNVDVILHAGDFFDTEKPSLDVLSKTFDILSEYKDIPFVSIYGNHEMRPKGFVNPVMLLSNGGFIRYVHGSSLSFKIDDETLNVFGLGYVPDERFRQIIGELLDKWDLSNGFNVLLTHQTIQDLMPISTDYISISEMVSFGFDLVVNGHIHSKYLSNNFIIPGSTVVTSIRSDEIEPRGVVVYDTNAKRAEFFEIPNQRPIVYERFELHGTTEIEIEKRVNEVYTQATSKYENPVIRIVILGTLKKGLSKSHIRLPRYDNLYVDLYKLEDEKIELKVKEWNKLLLEKKPMPDRINDLIESSIRDKVKILPTNFYLYLLERDEDDIIDFLLSNNAGVAKSGQRRRA